MKILIITFLVTQFCLAQIQPISEYRIPNGDYPIEKYAKVAVVQWAPSVSAPLFNLEAADQHKLNNIAQLEAYIREAHANGAELIITPEFGIVGYPDIPDLSDEDDNFRNREDISTYVETVPGKSTDYMASLARELKVTIHFGMAEKDPETDLYYNTVVVVGPTGEIITKYRKQHLYQIETNYLASGTTNVVYHSNLGKIGIVICSDVYASDVMELYKNEQLDILALSTSWAQYNSGWATFVRAAKWVNATVLAANHNYFPDSGVINPNGWAQSHIRQSDGLAYGFLLRKN